MIHARAETICWYKVASVLWCFIVWQKHPVEKGLTRGEDFKLWPWQNVHRGDNSKEEKAVKIDTAKQLGGVVFYRFNGKQWLQF